MENFSLSPNRGIYILIIVIQLAISLTLIVIMNTPNIKYSLLTTREKEVLNLIIDNHTTDSIAKELAITFETAKSHRKKI